MSYKWSAEQRINVLEVTAVLTEFRRRLRGPNMINKRIMNIVDRLVTYFALQREDLEASGSTALCGELSLSIWQASWW